MPRFTPKMNVFPSISLEMPEMCVETLRTRAPFFDLRFTKMNVFIYLLSIPINGVETVRTGLVFPRQLI